MSPSSTSTRRVFLANGAIAAVAGCTDVLDGESPLTAPSDWPRSVYDAAATGRNEEVSGPAEEPAIRWETDVHLDRFQEPAQVVADDTVFCAGGSVVTALDVADGAERWRTRVSPERRPGGSQISPAAVTVADDRVFVGNHDGLFAVGTDGTRLWSHTVPAVAGGTGVFRSPAVADGSVYFGLANEEVLVAATVDGEQRWCYDVGDPVVGGPAVADDRIFVGDVDVGVHAVSPGGDHLWTAPVGEVRTTPTVVDGTVYVVAHTDERGHLVAALDARTGDREWTNAGGPFFAGSPTVVRSRLACTTLRGTVLLYDRETGRLDWGTSVGSTGPTTVAIPASDGQRVYAPGDGLVAAIDGSEGRSWSVPVEGAEGTVAVTEGAVFLGSTDGTCYALA